MPSVGFETTISADERPQTYVIDSATSLTDGLYGCRDKISWYNPVRTQKCPTRSDDILTYHGPTEVFNMFPNFIPVSFVILSFLTVISTVFTWLSNYARHHKTEHHIVIYKTMETHKWRPVGKL